MQQVAGKGIWGEGTEEKEAHVRADRRKAIRAKSAEEKTQVLFVPFHL